MSAKKTLTRAVSKARTSGIRRRSAERPAVVLRSATSADSARLLAWRNDPETRRQSRTVTRVTRSTHDTWLTRVLTDPEVRLFIAEDHLGRLLGTGRLDYRGQATAEVNLTVAPEWRGRGVGGRIIRALGREAARLGWTRLVARVKLSNVRSVRAFIADGFVPDECLHLERDAAGSRKSSDARLR